MDEDGNILMGVYISAAIIYVCYYVIGIENRRGPSLEPCGTEMFLVHGINTAPLKLIRKIICL